MQDVIAEKDSQYTETKNNKFLSDVLFDLRMGFCLELIADIFLILSAVTVKIDGVLVVVA